MQSKWLKFSMIAVVVAFVAVAGFGAVAFAQGPVGTPTPGAFPGWGMHMGGMGGMGGPDDSLVAIAAKTLGLSQTDLVAALNSGKTIADVAKEKGVALDKIVAAVIAERTDDMQAAVTAGRMTQAQLDAMLPAMKANVTAQLSSKFTPRGYGMGRGFVDANNDGVCDICGTAQPNGQTPMGGMRGRWSK